MSHIKTYWQRLLDGWPVYVVIGTFLYGYSELWIDKKIAQGVALQVGADIKTEVALLSKDVDNLESSITRLDGNVTELNHDVKTVLLHLAGE